MKLKHYEIIILLLYNYIMNYHFEELVSACRDGNLEKARTIITLHPINIHAKNDKLIKTICETKNFNILMWVLELAEQLNDPFDLDSLMVNYILTQEESFINEFIGCIAKFNNRNNIENKDVDVKQNEETKIVVELVELANPNPNPITLATNEQDNGSQSVENNNEQCINTYSNNTPNVNIDKLLEQINERMESTNKFIEEFYNKITEKNNAQLNMGSSDNYSDDNYSDSSESEAEKQDNNPVNTNNNQNNSTDTDDDMPELVDDDSETDDNVDYSATLDPSTNLKRSPGAIKELTEGDTLYYRYSDDIHIIDRRKKRMYLYYNMLNQNLDASSTEDFNHESEELDNSKLSLELEPTELDSNPNSNPNPKPELVNSGLLSESKPREMISIELEEEGFDDIFYNLQNAKEMRRRAIKIIIDDIASLIEFKLVRGYCEYPIAKEQRKYFKEIKEILEKREYTATLKIDYANNSIIYIEW
jgi:hypothetical protein